jgi:hypothetical protein
VVARVRTGEDEAMVEPVTVWMVHLRRGAEPADVKGILALQQDALVFTHADVDAATRFTFAKITRVKRNRGTPILLIHWDEGGVRRTTAFYFVQPPPLNAEAHAGVDEAPPMVGLKRPTARRLHKRNATYLTSKSAMLKPIVQGWVNELATRIRAGGGVSPTEP